MLKISSLECRGMATSIPACHPFQMSDAPLQRCRFEASIVPMRLDTRLHFRRSMNCCSWIVSGTHTLPFFFNLLLSVFSFFFSLHLCRHHWANVGQRFWITLVSVHWQCRWNASWSVVWWPREPYLEVSDGKEAKLERSVHVELRLSGLWQHIHSQRACQANVGRHWKWILLKVDNNNNNNKKKQ